MELATVANTLQTSVTRRVLPHTHALNFARRKPLGGISIVVLVAVWTVALLSPVLARYGWDELYTGPRLAAPTTAGAHYFGTDNVGHDVFSRVLYGGRTTLLASVATTAGAIFFASLFGILSGYILGVYDLIFQRVSDALQALPSLIVLMVVAAVFAQSRIAVMITLMILQAPVSGRVMRSQTLVVRNQAYIEAARTIGASHLRIMLRHVLPNLLPLMIVLFSVIVGSNMLILTSLSFLGVVDSSTPDWGSMLNIGAQQFLLRAPWLAIFPGLAISLSVLAYNLLGDALRDVLDPRMRGTQR